MALLNKLLRILMFRTIFNNIKSFIEAVGFNSGGNGSTWIRDKEKTSDYHTSGSNIITNTLPFSAFMHIVYSRPQHYVTLAGH